MKIPHLIQLRFYMWCVILINIYTFRILTCLLLFNVFESRVHILCLLRFIEAFKLNTRNFAAVDEFCII